jgi:type II secretory pathway pseudopilin PulG
LPEVMVALLLVMLGASTLISTMAAARSRAASNLKFSVAFRLATELSDWTRQGGLRALAADTENPFDLLVASHSELNCFSNPCRAEEASIFYLYHWRRRLLLQVHDARVVICQGLPAARADQYKWECEEAESGSHSRVIKIGWGQGSQSGVHDFPPRLILALG